MNSVALSNKHHIQEQSKTTSVKNFRKIKIFDLPLFLRLFIFDYPKRSTFAFYYLLKCSTVAKFNNQIQKKMQTHSHFTSNPKAFIFEKKNIGITSSQPQSNSPYCAQVKDRVMFTSSIQIGSQLSATSPINSGFRGLQSFGRCVGSEVEREETTCWQSPNENIPKKQQVKVLSFRNPREGKGKMAASTIVSHNQQVPTYSFKFPIKTGQPLTAFSQLDALMAKNKISEVHQEIVDEPVQEKNKVDLFQFKKYAKMSASVFLNGQKPVFKLPTRRANPSISSNQRLTNPLSNRTNQALNQKESLSNTNYNSLFDQKPSSQQQNLPDSSINMFKKKNVLEIQNCSSSPERNLLKLLNSDKAIKEKPQQQKQLRKLSKSDFAIGKVMGKGQFGQVFLVIHKTTGFLCGMKVMSKKQIRQEKYINQISRELSIQSYLNHRFIAPLYGFFEDEDNVYLLIEFCSEGQLYQKLRKSHRLEQQETSMILREVCEGLDYIHKQQVIHRDIKPENIMFQFGTVKICDFGWAVYHNNQLRKTVSGTPLYYSPQLVMESEYDDKIDVWSIGMMAYECLLGKIPFKIYSEFDLKRIVEDEISFPEYVDVSDEAKSFILKIMKKKPQERMGIREMLRHPFIAKYAKCTKVSEQSLAEFRKLLSN